ncbi:MAG: sulfite oxidase-like oxidoreductase [Piscinibacter sp.]|nr:sulfite oxidase-like oxidoreductase [Piscinibacter sp.]
MRVSTRGFGGRRPAAATAGRLPPGQSWTDDFPVLSAGPTPAVDRTAWRFELKVGPRTLRAWTWEEFQALPQTQRVVDIHCVTTWSKLDTAWQGVTVDELLAQAGLAAPPTPFVLAHSVDGYSTNVPAADLLGGRALVATLYDGRPLAPDHGGPARLLVPHLYFWKSAKWVSALQFTTRDEAGFWELRGYHMRGDPFLEQRYSGD